MLGTCGAGWVKLASPYGGLEFCCRTVDWSCCTNPPDAAKLGCTGWTIEGPPCVVIGTCWCGTGTCTTGIGFCGRTKLGFPGGGLGCTEIVATGC